MKFRRRKARGMLAIQLLESPLGKLENLSLLRPTNHQKSQSKTILPTQMDYGLHR
jgi:hypothetical protein